MTDSDKNRILIVGLPKSGTTILTYRVADAYHNPKIFFEPSKEFGLRDLEVHKRVFDHPRGNIITKCLFVPRVEHRLQEVSQYYQKKLWIYRDPRDWIISSFMYRWKHLSDTSISDLVEKVRNKERNPEKVSFLSLLPPKYLESLEMRFRPLISVIDSLDESWLKVSYEDFVDGNTHNIEEYLGRNINNEVEVPNDFKRVVRSKSYGNWKHWFNKDDVLALRPVLDNILDSMNYADSWELVRPQLPNIEEGSEYLLKLLKLKMKNYSLINSLFFILCVCFIIGCSKKHETDKTDKKQQTEQVRKKKSQKLNNKSSADKKEYYQKLKSELAISDSLMTKIRSIEERFEITRKQLVSSGEWKGPNAKSIKEEWRTNRNEEMSNALGKVLYKKKSKFDSKYYKKKKD